eukprot:325103-Prorocentrum_minimum.AAC.1
MGINSLPVRDWLSFPAYTLSPQAEYEASLMRQFMKPRWANFTSALGQKVKGLWENGLLDQLSYASVLLPPLAVSLIFMALGCVLHCTLSYTSMIYRRPQSQTPKTPTGSVCVCSVCAMVGAHHSDLRTRDLDVRKELIRSTSSQRRCRISVTVPPLHCHNSVPVPPPYNLD